SLVFSSLIVGALAATFAILVAGRSSLTRVLGLSVSVPELLRSGLAGGRRTLAIGGIGLLTLATLGSILDALTQSGTTLGSALGTLLTAVIDLLLRWLDQALLLLLGASTFLYDGGFAWSAPGARAGWMWLAIPVLVAAYLA